MLERTPLQILQDPYLDISGVAVDPVRDEIVLLTGQRDAQIMVYDRMADTPAEVEILQPKRVIKGPKTKIGAPGIYVDSKTGEIYTVDTTHGMYAGSGNRIVMFSHSIEGNKPPERELQVPHRGFAIAADEQAQELYVTVQHPPAVVVYSKSAKDNEAPLRILEGSQTKLTDVHGIALDSKNKVMFVANRGSWSGLNEEREWSGVPIQHEGDSRTWDIPTRIEAHMIPGSGEFRSPSITVYPLKASGNTAPTGTIQGPSTQLGWPAFITLDDERQELYVANSWPHSILVFNATDRGNATPIRVIKGVETILTESHWTRRTMKLLLPIMEIILPPCTQGRLTVIHRRFEPFVWPRRATRFLSSSISVPWSTTAKERRFWCRVASHSRRWWPSRRVQRMAIC
jgi:DNA-binding beta-propeller fold protein YncE